jgi:putative two-component system response regulator
MKRHTVIGHELLADSSSALLRTAAEIALTHHERFDGSGYPQRLSGKEIPMHGRICALADCFDAMTLTRPRRFAMKLEDAVAEIDRGSGTLFDPALVRGFRTVLPEIMKVRELYPDTMGTRFSL